MSKTASAVQIEVSRRLVRVRLSRPDRYNVLDTATLTQLAAALAPAARRQVPLLLEADGEIFSVGSDITEMAKFSSADARAYSRLGQQVVTLLESWPGVTVARLTGYALGTGLELALGCDVLVGATDVRLGLPGLAWAMVPCLGGLRRLAVRLSKDLCSELFLGGEVLDAQQALEAGLLDRIADEGVERLVLGFGEFPPGAVAAIRSIRLERQGRIDDRAEAELFAQPFASGECQKRLKKLLAG
jgi:enoyl-CoA hydratase/carnithine racemase